MSVNLACPSCQSDNVQRVAMAHAQNTSVVFDHRNRAAGVQQTAMGIALSPPKPRKLWWRWLITGYFGVATIASIPMAVFHVGALIGLITVAVLAVLGYRTPGRVPLALAMGVNAGLVHLLTLLLTSSYPKEVI